MGRPEPLPVPVRASTGTTDLSGQWSTPTDCTVDVVHDLLSMKMMDSSTTRARGAARAARARGCAGGRRAHAGRSPPRPRVWRRPSSKQASSHDLLSMKMMDSSKTRARGAARAARAAPRGGRGARAGRSRAAREAVVEQEPSRKAFCRNSETSVLPAPWRRRVVLLLGAGRRRRRRGRQLVRSPERSSSSRAGAAANAIIAGHASSKQARGLAPRCSR